MPSEEEIIIIGGPKKDEDGPVGDPSPGPTVPPQTPTPPQGGG